MYELIPDDSGPPDRRGPYILLIFALLGVFAFLIIVRLPPRASPLSRAATMAPRPTARPTATEVALRTAWIEARDTCLGSREYGDKVASGATLWKGEGSSKDATGRSIPHAALVRVLNESTEWTRIQRGGTVGYVQSFFIVDYDPNKDFQPATGSTRRMLCN